MCESHSDGKPAMSRRAMFSSGAAAATLAAAIGAVAVSNEARAEGADIYAEPAKPALPPSNMVLRASEVALVVTDPQIDFLSPKGVTWGVVGENVQRNKTVENIGKLFRAAKAKDITVAVSPHYYYPTDHGWKFEGALEKLMHSIGMFDRKGPLTLDGFRESGADFMAEYKEFIEDGKTIITSPHKVYGPDSNDLGLQLRKRGVTQVILAGMSANLCVESHMRELLELGFEVAVVKDATAAAVLPDGDGYLAALTNFRYMANALWTADQAVELIGAV